MSTAAISVAALVVAVTVSCTTTINVGVLAMAMAFMVGVFAAGMSPAQVVEGFPTNLLVTLIGVTLLFSIAECNGTLERLTSRAMRVCRGHRGLMPVMFFGLGLGIATIGAGATPASALLAPAAMATAARAGIPALQMAVMAGNGALAGTLSPFAPTGLVSNGVMERIGLGGVEWQTYAYNALAHTIVGFGGFMLLGGWKLFRGAAGSVRVADVETQGMESKHWLTLGGIGALVLAVAGLRMDVGMTALILSAALILLRTVDEARAIQRIPWAVILMVSGVTVLVAMMEETKGLELLTTGIAHLADQQSIVPIVALGAGVVSIYSSTSGVVLPAFLPMVPDLAQRMGGVEPLPIAWSMNVGASLVDLSSLSTVGALFIAGAAPGSDTRALFNGLLIWGISMAVVGAVLSWALLS